MKRKTIFIGADHGGFKLKNKIKKFLASKNYLVEDIGPYKFNKDDDYPDFALKLCQKVLKARSKGILICKTGQGMSIAANKIKGIRAALCWNEQTAIHASKNLDANVLCIGSIIEKATKLVEIWLTTPYEKAKRYIRRLNKIKAIEKIFEK